MSITNPSNTSRASAIAVRSNTCAKARRVAVRRSNAMRRMAWARAAAAYLAMARPIERKMVEGDSAYAERTNGLHAMQSRD